MDAHPTEPIRQAVDQLAKLIDELQQKTADLEAERRTLRRKLYLIYSAIEQGKRDAQSDHTPAES